MTDTTTATLIRLTREQFLALDPHWRTAIDAPALVTRILPDRTILHEGVAVELIDGSPTPRTDALAFSGYNDNVTPAKRYDGLVDANFARDLERELAKYKHLAVLNGEAAQRAERESARLRAALEQTLARLIVQCAQVSKDHGGKSEADERAIGKARAALAGVQS